MGQLVSNPLLHSIYRIFIAIIIIILGHLCLSIHTIIAIILPSVIGTRAIHFRDILIRIPTRVNRLRIMIKQLCLICVLICILILIIFGDSSLRIMMILNSILLAPLLKHFFDQCALFCRH